MFRSIDTRLQRLEAAKPTRIILEVTVGGQAQRMTARQFVESGFTWPDARIVAGNNLDDARALLGTVPSVIS